MQEKLEADSSSSLINDTSKLGDDLEIESERRSSLFKVRNILMELSGIVEEMDIVQFTLDHLTSEGATSASGLDYYFFKFYIP